jgi:hypothetical protein
MYRRNGSEVEKRMNFDQMTIWQCHGENLEDAYHTILVSAHGGHGK